MATKLTSKGQVTVPQWVRDYLALKPGAAVNVERLASGDIVLRTTKRTSTRGSPMATLRGRATVRMQTEEILALTRGA